MARAQREFVRYVYGIIVIDTHAFISGSVCAISFGETPVGSLFSGDQYS